MRPTARVLSVMLCLTVPQSARAEEPRAVEAPPPPRPGLPPCADMDDETNFRTSTGCAGVFGLRGSVTRVEGVSASEGSGIMASAEGQELVRGGVFSARGLHRMAIGGGAAGFEGTLQLGLAVGFRLPVGRRHGPVIRAGGFGYLRGNQAFYGSLLDLPQAQIGYQYLRRRTAIEIGATGGVVLTGRERAGQARRRVLGTGFEQGGYLMLQVPWFRFGASVMRLPTDDAIDSPVDVAEATACALAKPVAICADARATRMDAVLRDETSASEVRALYAGVVLGLTRER